VSELEKRLIAFFGILGGQYLPWGMVSEMIGASKSMVAQHDLNQDALGTRDFDAAQKLTTELLDGIRL
jgi:hypothetical protein